MKHHPLAFHVAALFVSLALFVPAWAQAPGTRCTRITVEGNAPTPEQLRQYPRCKRLAAAREGVFPNRPPFVHLTFLVSQSWSAPAGLLHLRAVANDPDGDALLYTWSTTGGRISGEGADVVWNLAGAQPGTYTVSVEADDGCGCVAFESATITVEK
jgi:hypothetical protein